MNLLEFKIVQDLATLLDTSINLLPVDYATYSTSITKAKLTINKDEMMWAGSLWDHRPLLDFLARTDSYMTSVGAGRTPAPEFYQLDDLGSLIQQEIIHRFGDNYMVDADFSVWLPITPPELMEGIRPLSLNQFLDMIESGYQF